MRTTSLPAANKGIDATICTGCLPNGQSSTLKCAPAPNDADSRTASNSRSEKESRFYALGKSNVEMLIVQIKEVLGPRCFLLRGMNKVYGE